MTCSADREDCFLAAFDHAVEELAAVVLPAWEGEGGGMRVIRAGLGALLGFLEREPALRRLVFVEALGAGSRVLAAARAGPRGSTGRCGSGPRGCEGGPGSCRR